MRVALALVAAAALTVALTPDRVCDNTSTQDRAGSLTVTVNYQYCQPTFSNDADWIRYESVEVQNDGRN